MYKIALLLIFAVLAVATAQFISTPYYGSTVVHPTGYLGGLGLYRSGYYGGYATPYAYRGGLLGYRYY